MVIDSMSDAQGSSVYKILCKPFNMDHSNTKLFILIWFTFGHIHTDNLQIHDRIAPAL